ncbi:hypothetical protein L9F63_027415, partial [Diploptera punctata]
KNHTGLGLERWNCVSIVCSLKLHMHVRTTAKQQLEASTRSSKAAKAENGRATRWIGYSGPIAWPPKILRSNTFGLINLG